MGKRRAGMSRLGSTASRCNGTSLRLETERPDHAEPADLGMSLVCWSKPDSNRRSPREGTGSPAALIEIVSGLTWPTAKRTEGLLVRICFPPAENPLRTQFGQRRLADEIAAGPSGGSSPVILPAIAILIPG
jgi:hypothetical protein